MFDCFSSTQQLVCKYMDFYASQLVSEEGGQQIVPGPGPRFGLIGPWFCVTFEKVKYVNKIRYKRKKLVII